MDKESRLRMLQNSKALVVGEKSMYAQGDLSGKDNAAAASEHGTQQHEGSVGATSPSKKRGALLHAEKRLSTKMKGHHAASSPIANTDFNHTGREFPRAFSSELTSAAQSLQQQHHRFLDVAVQRQLSHGQQQLSRMPSGQAQRMHSMHEHLDQEQRRLHIQLLGQQQPEISSLADRSHHYSQARPPFVATGASSTNGRGSDPFADMLRQQQEQQFLQLETMHRMSPPQRQFQPQMNHPNWPVSHQITDFRRQQLGRYQLSHVPDLNPPQFNERGISLYGHARPRRLSGVDHVSHEEIQSSMRHGSSLPSQSPSTFALRLPVCIARQGDELKLSSHQVLLRHQIEVFQATEDDTLTHTRGRNKPITLKQVGIRCRHCAHLPVSQRMKGSTYYPATVMGIYQAAQNMSTMHLQCGLCSEMPNSIKQQFSLLLATKVVSSGAGRPFWADGARKLGLVDTVEGIHFIRDIPPGLRMIDADDAAKVSSRPSKRNKCET